MSVITYAEAVRIAMSEEMRRDESVLFMKEDIGKYCGAFGVSRGMFDDFGEECVIDTPTSLEEEKVSRGRFQGHEACFRN